MSYSATSSLPILLKLECKDIFDVGGVLLRTIIRREWLLSFCGYCSLNYMDWRLLGGSLVVVPIVMLRIGK
jgi:hypothetical protein